MNINKEARKFTTNFLNQIGFKDEISLPLIDNISIKNIQEIGKRIIQLYGLIGLSLSKINSDKVKQWLLNNDLFISLSEKEQEYFQRYKSNGLTKKEITSLSWLRECLYTLMWCTEIVSELPYPSNESELDKYLYLIPPNVNISEFLQNLRIRNHNEIINQTDLHYCLHWLIRSDLSNSLLLNFQPKIDVIIERRKAFEWLITMDVWDDISLDT